MSYLAIAGLQLEVCAEDNLSLLEQEIDLVKKRFPWIQMVVLPMSGKQEWQDLKRELMRPLEPYP